MVVRDQEAMGAQTEIDRDLYFSSSVVHVWLNTTAMVGQALQHTRPTCRNYKAPDQHRGYLVLQSNDTEVYAAFKNFA
jgi:hypothetical protein